MAAAVQHMSGSTHRSMWDRRSVSREDLAFSTVSSCAARAAASDAAVFASLRDVSSSAVAAASCSASSAFWIWDQRIRKPCKSCRGERICGIREIGTACQVVHQATGCLGSSQQTDSRTATHSRGNAVVWVLQALLRISRTCVRSRAAEASA